MCVPGASLPLSPPFFIHAYLYLLVLDGEQHDDGQAAYDDALQHEQDRPQHPVEAGDAGAGIDAALAAGGALQALERFLYVVFALFALKIN